ncbi:hypothetical protein AB0M02_10705 [Actinoplanes sp. NPDC051861]|uniref:hypothetical protein n=1 Tax=Actinoplanes sp. NPDC051861 TaxID=3155170 RepID=UPI00343844AC
MREDAGTANPVGPAGDGPELLPILKAAQPQSQKQERAYLAQVLRSQGRTTGEIAEAFRLRYRVNARVAFRYAYGWSQARVASEWCDRWPGDPKTGKVISTWEVWPNGGHAPSLQTIGRLAEIYECSVAQLLADFPDHGHTQVGGTESENAVHGADKPNSLSGLTALPEVAGLADPRHYSAAHNRNLAEESNREMQRRSAVGLGVLLASSLGGVLTGYGKTGWRVGAADVARLDGESARLRSLCALHGGNSLWRAALGVAREGYQKLEQGQYSHAVGELLQQAIGRAEMCAGWLAMDSGQHDVARSSFNEALSLARQVNDAHLEIHALCNLALQSNFLGMPRQALRFTEAAERVSKDVPPKVRAVLSFRRATAFALMGDEISIAGAILEARRGLDHASPDPTSEWWDFVTPAEINGIEGTCMLHLSRHKSDPHYARRAVRALESAIAQHGRKFIRNKALYRVRLAEGHLKLGNVPEAAHTGAIALNELGNDLASTIVATELDGVAKAFAPHAGATEVDAFLSRYDAAKASRIGELV